MIDKWREKAKNKIAIFNTKKKQKKGNVVTISEDSVANNSKS